MKTLILTVILCAFSSTLFAQNSAAPPEKKKKSKITQTSKSKKKKRRRRRKKLKNPNLIVIEYGANSWNKSSEKIDTAFLFIRDKKTKKVLKVFLDETAPDSAIFKGTFSIVLKNKKVYPEVFIPPQNLRSDKLAGQFNTLLLKGKVKKKPLFFRVDEGRRVIDVFDNRKQLFQAKKNYKAKKEAEKLKKSLVKAIPKKEDIEAQKKTQELAKEAEQKILEANLKAERIRLEQIEEQKRKERLAVKAKLKAEEIAKRKAKAKEWAIKGGEAFTEGKFKKAQDSFEKSIDLNPDDQSYYFKYAVSMYRNNQLNQALVIFKIIENQPQQDKMLINYYMGLIHYRLKELKASTNRLQKVKDSKSSYAPSATFYLGMIHFFNKNWDPAQAEFEWVLDNSKDPKLDQRAEDYIENIARQKQFEKKKKHRNDVSVTIGLMQDSNVTLASDTSIDQGTATDIASARFVLSGSYAYRALFEQKNNLSFNYDAYYVYSINSAVSAADPLLHTISAPYSRTTKLWGKGFNWSIKPAFETLYMEATSGSDSNGTGVRENILNAVYINSRKLFIMSPTWFSTYTLEFRQDDSILSTSTGDEDADSTKITISTDQSFFFDSGKKKGVVTKFGVISNGAKGKNKKYTRIDLGATYIAPWKSWEASWTAGLLLYQSSYSSDDGRTDTNATLTMSLSKPWNQAWSSSAAMTYTSNSSNVEANAYNKYTILFSGTYSGAF